MTVRGYNIIGQALAKAGASHAFGIPGGEVLAVMQGLNEAGLQFVLVKHENSGGFFAEGLWHMTGALPVLVATLGPGVANAVNVVANAMQDRVPLIFLTGCVDAAEAESYTHQVFDHQALLRPIVKGTFRLSKGAIGVTMAKAIALAKAGQPGPVHIDVPIDVAEALTSEAHAPDWSEQALGLPAQEALNAALHALQNAKRPLAIAGVDAVNAEAGAQIAAFCNGHDIPLITTYKGKGLMDEAEPLCLGGMGLSPLADKIVMPLIGEADAILLIGYDPIEMRIGWRNPWTDKQNVIEITPVTRTHAMHSANIVLRSDIAQTLKALAHKAPKRWPDGKAGAARKALKAAFARPANWGPHQVFQTLRDALPDGTVATADSGAHRILFSQMWECKAPRTLLQSSGLCTMACALPLAAGAKMGRANAPVLCVVGDAGLDMGAGELATLRDLKLPVIVCVLVDESLGLIELKQRGSQRPNLGVDFGSTDFAAVAKAYGGHGVAIRDVESLRSEIGDALTRESFTVLAVEIGARAYDGAF